MALERPLARVGANVINQVACLCKLAATVITLVRMLTGMEAKLSNQMVCLCEAFLAVAALVYLAASAGALVIFYAHRGPATQWGGRPLSTYELCPGGRLRI